MKEKFKMRRTKHINFLALEALSLMDNFIPLNIKTAENSKLHKLQKLEFTFNYLSKMSVCLVGLD